MYDYKLLVKDYYDDGMVEFIGADGETYKVSALEGGGELAIILYNGSTYYIRKTDVPSDYKYVACKMITEDKVYVNNRLLSIEEVYENKDGSFVLFKQEKSYIPIRLGTSKIHIGEAVLRIGMPYEDVNKKLKGMIYSKREPDKSGNGHIIVKDVDFASLWGTCTIYFQKEVLRQIAVKPEYNNYALTTDDTGKMVIDKAVSMIAHLNKLQLEDELRTSGEKIGEGSLLYRTGGLAVITSVSREGDSYSVIIK